MRFIFPKKLLCRLLLLYSLLMLPVMLVLIKSDYIQFVLKNTVSHWLARISRPQIVFIGDSITAGGGINSILDIDNNPFNDINLAQNGLEIRQITMLLEKALAYEPKFIIFLGGTNDLSNPRLSDEAIITDFSSLIERVRNKHSKLIVTLIPYQRKKEFMSRIKYLNQEFLRIASKSNIPVIDLNPFIAYKGKLDEKYSADGVHLNATGYHLWAEILKDKLKTIEASNKKSPPRI